MNSKLLSTSCTAIATLLWVIDAPAAPAPHMSASEVRQAAGEMAVIRGGEFRMGDTAGDGTADEKPVHLVRVKTFRIGRTEVTRGQFGRFVRATGYRTDAEQDFGDVQGCNKFDLAAGKRGYAAGFSWRDPGFMQSDDHPVVCVSWNDAQAFVSWLNQQSGQKFRLPSEAEWEYAARAGNVAKYPWGMDADQACRFANGGDQTPYPDNSGRAWANPLNCKDGYFYTAPVGSFASSDFGLKDMIGNALEWTQDCENESYSGAPSDGSAWTSGNCDRRVVRGGSWAVGAASLRVSYRGRTGAANRHDNDGFRLAHD